MTRCLPCFWLVAAGESIILLWLLELVYRKMEGEGMNVRSCKICKRLFNYLSGPVYCPVCRDKMEEKFQEVKAFIQENPGVHIQEVADACEVETAQIRQWLREDRLELTEGSPLLLSCDGCGAPIRSGRYCDKCKAKVSLSLINI